MCFSASPALARSSAARFPLARRLNVSLLNEVMRRFLRQQSHIMDGAARGSARSEKAASVCAQLNGCFMLIILCPVGFGSASQIYCTKKGSCGGWLRTSVLFHARARASLCVLDPDRRVSQNPSSANPCWYYNLVNAHPRNTKGCISSKADAGTLSLTHSHIHVPHQTHARTGYICGVHAQWTCTISPLRFEEILTGVTVARKLQ
jgi:hypothetical protein